MAATDDDDEEANKAQEAADAGRTAADAAAAEALDWPRGTGAVTAGRSTHPAPWTDPTETVTAYEVASAALRRLPMRRAPIEKEADARIFAAVSPSSSRFKVPPPPLSKTTRAPAMQPSPHTSPQRGGESVQLTPAEGQCFNSVNLRPRMVEQDSEDASEVASVRSDDYSEGLEEDVAARVLFSLQQKDGVIEQLTRTVETLRSENAVLRRSCAAAAEANVAPPLSASASAVSPDRFKTSSPSWPATPVHWWKTEHNGLQAPEKIDDIVVKKQSLHLSPSLSAAHAAVSTIEALQRRLADKEAELAALKERVVAHDKAQAACGAGTPAAAPSMEHSAGGSLASDARGAPSASLSAAEAVAQARIAQLEWQLENVQQEKREDAHTLRDHIDHLTRELHRKSRDMARQQRQHKLELTALQQEVTALANQMEDQIRSSASTAAGAASREPEAEQVAELRRQLGQAKAREALLLNENAAARQRWLLELKEQASLLDAVRAKAAQEEEAQGRSRVQEERQLAQKAAQQLEAQVLQYKSALAHAQRELSELRAVHQRTEEMMNEQRQQLQRVSQDIAATALERAHDEQRAASAEQQIALLQQQLRQAAATIASQEREVETLQQTRREEAAAAVALQEEEHAALLTRVEGCVKGSEAVEGALLAAERSRQEIASELARALEERDSYHRLYREASVQAQAQLLEQQQLLSEGNDVMCRRLREVERDLVHRTEALETTQRELRAVQERIPSLKNELARSEAAQRQLGEELQAAQARHEAQTEELVHAKEGLKDALHAQLATMGKLRRKEQQLRSQRAAAQRSMERRQEEQRVLQRIADLLRPPAVPLLPAALTSLQLRRSASVVTPGGFAALSRSDLSMLARSPNTKMRKSCRAAQRPLANRVDALAAGGANIGFGAGSSDVGSTGCPSRSASPMPSAATSVVMSAVSWADVPAPSLDDGGGATLDDDDHTAARAGEEGDVSTRSRSAAFAVASPHSRVGGGLTALERQLQRPLAPRKGDGRAATAEMGHHVLPLLRDIHDAVEQVCAAYTAAQQELGTRRAAVRTLVKERKAQQAQLEELRAALQEQQRRADRQRRDVAESARTESQVELEKAKRTWRERHQTEMALQQQSYSEQHRRAVVEVLKVCAEYVQAAIVAFVQLLPTTLSAGLAAAAAKSAERTREEVLRSVPHQRWCPSNTPSAAHHPLYGDGYGAQAPHAGTAARGAADESLLSLGLEVQPEVQAECDAIVRDVLGMAGGWSDLTSAVLVASYTAATDYPAGGSPPSTAWPAPQLCAFGYDPAVASSDAPRTAEPAKRSAVDAEAARWSAEEVAELEEVIHAHLTRSLAALTAAASLSSLAGVSTSVSESRGGEEGQGVYGHTRDALSALSESTAAQRVAALPRWMRSRQTSTHQASPSSPFSGVRDAVGTSAPPKSASVEEAVTASVPLHHEQPRLLALLLDACVAQVLERLLA
ncbi:hypothetical protein LSCM1_07838 [Leishmania martiniquensis]|uniref:Uncharacterized protein n=1 Tax=Leishmania martiniquensis TaxID=1580590 RepID=A0A836H281_9TRYP|nr:hypothetical protein LSCM1_07838 [Leishmania martiniquensis]